MAEGPVRGIKTIEIFYETRSNDDDNEDTRMAFNWTHSCSPIPLHLDPFVVSKRLCDMNIIMNDRMCNNRTALKVALMT